MSENILKQFLNENYGYIRTRDFEKLGISRPSIQNYIDKKIIRKVSRGLYIDNNLIEDEFFILQRKFSNIIFSYNTACYLLNLSDRAPYKIDITTLNHNNISEDLNQNKDDFSFIEVSNEMVKNSVVKICEKALLKGYNDRDIQVLCPMYKGENGIEALNSVLQNIFNPKAIEKKEYKHGDVIYREGDKVLQLVNMPDENIFNGDIGTICNIKQAHESVSNKIENHVDFDGNGVKYNIKDLINITHAYAISIHKAQGSEFKIVVMPIVNSYRRMLYKKLIYTGITRAKSSLILIGNKDTFKYGISVSEENMRKTTLQDMIKNSI